MEGGTPELVDYAVWHDVHGYHARYIDELSEAAIARGCVREIHDPDPHALLAAAVRNRISVWVAETRPAPKTPDSTEPR